MEHMTKLCNICGSTKFIDMGNRKNVRCAQCNSLERTRVLGLFLGKLGYPKPGMKILHLAPEKGLANIFINVVGKKNYFAKDIEPEKYKFCNVDKIDLCKDSDKLPKNYFDIIIHSHVIEHVRCNYTAVLYHLHSSLKTNGIHICSIPVMKGYYDETTEHISDEEKTIRFGQFDHVRKFGDHDLKSSLGMIFNFSDSYDIEKIFDFDDLERFNIPSYARKGFTPNTVFIFRKDDIKLKSKI